MTALAGDVWNAALPASRRAAAQAILATSFQDPIARALVAVEVAYLDSVAHAAEDISSDLVARGFVSSGPLDALVAPCVLRYRTQGAPWAQFWDIDNLRLLLLEFWAADRRKLATAAMVAAELVERFSVSPRLASALVVTTTADVAAVALDDAVRFPSVARLLASRSPENVLFEPADLSGHRGLDQRPDLAAVLGDMALAHALIDVGGDVADEAREWMGGLGAQLWGLTTFETELMTPVPDSDRYQRDTLTAGRGSFNVPLLTAGALPSNRDIGRSPPQWMRDHIVKLGYRMWHGHITPYALWVATAESDAEAALYAPVTAAGETTLGFWKTGDVVHVDILLDPAGEDGALMIPFIYDLKYPSEAWQLLHLASTRRVRLTVVQMSDDGELTVIGVVGLVVPPDAGHNFSTLALERLRVLVGDDMAKTGEAAAGLI